MIERIEIHNYKSIRDAKIDLKQLNILIGPNGAGKSNFISFFELTRNLLEQRLGSYMLEHGGIDSMLYRGRKVSDSISALIDFNNINAFSFCLRPMSGLKAYIQYTKEIIIATQSIELINHFDFDDLLIADRDDNQSTFRRLNEQDFAHWRDAHRNVRMLTTF